MVFIGCLLCASYAILCRAVCVILSRRKAAEKEKKTKKEKKAKKEKKERKEKKEKEK